MVKGPAECNGVVLYDMAKDEFFTVSAAEFAAHNNFICLDETLRVTDPKAWERQLEQLNRAYQRCGIAEQSE